MNPGANASGFIILSNNIDVDPEVLLSFYVVRDLRKVRVRHGKNNYFYSSVTT